MLYILILLIWIFLLVSYLFIFIVKFLWNFKIYTWKKHFDNDNPIVSLKELISELTKEKKDDEEEY
jgi:hypothetical protein